MPAPLPPARPCRRHQEVGHATWPRVGDTVCASVTRMQAPRQAGRLHPTLPGAVFAGWAHAGAGRVHQVCAIWARTTREQFSRNVHRDQARRCKSAGVVLSTTRISTKREEVCAVPAREHRLFNKEGRVVGEHEVSRHLRMQPRHSTRCYSNTCAKAWWFARDERQPSTIEASRSRPPRARARAAILRTALLGLQLHPRIPCRAVTAPMQRRRR